ncbi:hypothetical protein GJU41_00150 [Bacillus idriensis]|uniref:Uncharacterized protein n=1 Tax=Metabacillus idriensis TaxID=324768 RepID=A0A6I2M6B9_9BACI|nr:hypothetical protein [Metabacillus idriensis]MRX52366.1 hypothetical protein [Metabacillus idriensis]
MAENTNNPLDMLKAGLAEPIVKNEAYQFNNEAMGNYMKAKNAPIATLVSITRFKTDNEE